MPSRIDQCPSCSGPLEVRELYCPACDIQIRGHFTQGEPTAFGNLTSEQEAFLRVFVLSRGNLSDVERSLGVSYPTVRAKLDDLIAAFSGDGGKQEDTPPPLSRQEVLSRVASGQLSAADGMAMLKQLSGEG